MLQRLAAVLAAGAPDNVDRVFEAPVGRRSDRLEIVEGAKNVVVPSGREREAGETGLMMSPVRWDRKRRCTRRNSWPRRCAARMARTLRRRFAFAMVFAEERLSVAAANPRTMSPLKEEGDLLVVIVSRSLTSCNYRGPSPT